VQNSLNLDFVRSQFPGLASEWVFMDNAGGSQILQGVADRVHEYLLSNNVQLGASYEPSQIASQRVIAAGQAVASFINAADSKEIVMGPSTTQLLSNLALAMKGMLKPGDEIIVTNCDHEANIGPWMRLTEQEVRVKVWNLNPETLALDLEDLDKLMTEHTRLVCFTHASNILGTINPVKDIAAFVHQRGAHVCVDGVAFAPHRAVDVRGWDVDYYVFSFYKVYGPHHAVLYGKRDLLNQLDNLNHYFIANNDTPYKFQPGNVNYELSYGTVGIVDYFEELAQQIAPAPITTTHDRVVMAYDAIASHEEALAAHLLEYLGSKSNVRVIGSSSGNREVRVPTVSFIVNQRSSTEFPQHMDNHHIGIRYGHFYAKRLIDDLGLAVHDGVVRASMVHYNTLEEINRLINHLDEVL